MEEKEFRVGNIQLLAQGWRERDTDVAHAGSTTHTLPVLDAHAHTHTHSYKAAAAHTLALT